MLETKISYLQNYNNYNSQDIILNYKYQIKLLSFYLMTTFKSIESALDKSEEILNEIPKNKINNNNKENSSSTTSISESANFEEKIEDFIESFKGIYKNGNVGKYYWKIRVMKILKYKFK